MSVSRNVPLFSSPGALTGGTVSGISSLSTQTASTGQVSLDISGGSQAVSVVGGTGGIQLGISSALSTPSSGILLGTSAAGLARVETAVTVVGQPSLSGSQLSNNYTLASPLSTSGGSITTINLNSPVSVPMAVGNNIVLISGANRQVLTLSGAVTSGSPTSTLTVNAFTPNFSYPVGTIVNLATLTVNGPFESGASSVVGPLSVSGNLALGGSLTGVASVLTRVETCSDLSLGFTTDAGNNFVETTFLFATTTSPTYSATVTLTSPVSGMNGFRKRITLCRWTITGGLHFVFVQPDVPGTKFYPPGSLGSTQMMFDTQGQSTELTWCEPLQGWFVLGTGAVFN